MASAAVSQARARAALPALARAAPHSLPPHVLTHVLRPLPTALQAQALQERAERDARARLAFMHVDKDKSGRIDEARAPPANPGCAARVLQKRPADQLP
jgi:hypothetical protein